MSPKWLQIVDADEPYIVVDGDIYWIQQCMVRYNTRSFVAYLPVFFLRDGVEYVYFHGFEDYSGLFVRS